MREHDVLSRLLLTFLLLAVAACSAGSGGGDADGIRFEVTVSADLEPDPVDGRVILIVSSLLQPEPRFQGLRSLQTPQNLRRRRRWVGCR